jgi:hypothetical protein
MKKLDRDMKLRVFILDSLVAQSGKPLLPDLIGKLTTEILERVKDIIDAKEKEV